VRKKTSRKRRGVRSWQGSKEEGRDVYGSLSRGDGEKIVTLAMADETGSDMKRGESSPRGFKRGCLFPKGGRKVKSEYLFLVLQ